MIVFAGIAPSSPLLLAGINPEGLPLVERTRLALSHLAEDLAAVAPDTIVLFAEAVTMYPDAFSFNVADPFVADLADFGDLGYTKTYHPDFALIDKLQRELRGRREPVTLSTDTKLTYHAGVPLDFLTKHLPDVRIIPIAPCGRDSKDHFSFGVALKNILQDTTRRVAIIACGDTAHALNEDSPVPAHPSGKRYDDMLVSLVENRNAVGLMQLDPELIQNAKDGVYRQTLMLFGALENISATPIIHSHEAPLGVGHLVAELRLD